LKPIFGLFKFKRPRENKGGERNEETGKGGS